MNDDTLLAGHIEKIETNLNNIAIGDHLAVMIEKDESFTRFAAALCIKFGRNNVKYGGEPAMFPNTVRVLIYRE